MRIERKKVITAKELKNRTGAALRYVAKGGKVLVTKRGKPIALITHPDQDRVTEQPMLRAFDEAWKDIEEALKRTEPFFESWKEGENWSRKRKG